MAAWQTWNAGHVIWRVFEWSVRRLFDSGRNQKV